MREGGIGVGGSVAGGAAAAGSVRVSGRVAGVAHAPRRIRPMTRAGRVILELIGEMLSPPENAESFLRLRQRLSNSSYLAQAATTISWRNADEDAGWVNSLTVR